MTGPPTDITGPPGPTPVTADVLSVSVDVAVHTAAERGRWRLIGHGEVVMTISEFAHWLVGRLAWAGPALVLTMFVFPQADHAPPAVFWITAAVWAATVVTQRGGRPGTGVGAGLVAAWVVVALGLLTEGLRALLTARPLAWHPTVPFALFVSAVVGLASLVDAVLLRRRLAATTEQQVARSHRPRR